MKRDVSGKHHGMKRWGIRVTDYRPLRELRLRELDFEHLPVALAPIALEGLPAMTDVPGWQHPYARGVSERLFLYGGKEGRLLDSMHIWLDGASHQEIEQFSTALEALGTVHPLELGRPRLAVPLHDFLSVVCQFTRIIAKSKLETRIMDDPAWQKGVLHGKPRPGHPEGRVIYHIADVLQNVDRIAAGYGADWREQLRLIALIHDTFKYQENRALPRVGENHHAWKGRRFAENYLLPPSSLTVLEWHDQAYYCWKHGVKTGKWEVAEAELEKLLAHLGSALQLYYIFFRCDTETGDKNQEPVRWFEKQAGSRIVLP